MNRIIKELKKQRYTTICIVCFLILLIVFYLIYNMIFGSRGTPILGNRLEGIESVLVTNDTWNKILTNLNDEKIVVDAKKVTEDEGTVDRIINIIITVSDGTKIANAKKLTSIVTKELTDDQLDYFDIEIYFVCENTESKNYPMIGYKSKTSEEFSFSGRK